MKTRGKIKMKHDLSRDRDSVRNVHVVGRMALSFHQERNGKMDKAATAFIPAFLGSPYGWPRVGHQEMLVGGCVCASTILFNLFSRVSQVPRIKEEEERAHAVNN